jgi:glycosyltransferase involved in cell wall biosynthesis
MNLLLLPRYGRLGSTSRLRFYQYLPHLEAHGVRVTSLPLLNDEYVRRLYAGERQSAASLARAYARRLAALLRARRFDLAWVEKEFLPWLPAFAPSLLRIPYAADYDDAAFHRYDQHPNPLVRRLLGGKIDTVMRRAALVIAGNAYLAQHARQAGAPRVETLPTVIDTRRYGVTPPREPGSFRVGWIGAPVTVNYLRLIQPALERVIQPGTSLTLVGAADPLGGRVPLESRPWSESTEVAEIQRFDAGIMPLPDEPFERGKCGYKLIQYMGCGLPVVASPVGVNTRIVEHGVNGFLAGTQDEWVAALDALRRDPALRQRMGAAGRAKVEQEYSLETAAPRLLAMLEAARRRPA